MNEGAVLDGALAGAVSILIAKFEDHIERIECSLIKDGHPRFDFYRTGFIKKEI